MKAGSDFRGVLSRAARLVAAAAWLAGAACGPSRGGGGEPASPALSSSTAAQVELHRLLQRFATASRAERVALEPELTAFRRRRAGDDLARVAAAHLAWIALDRGDLARASSIAAEVIAQAPGTARDLALVVRGAALRRGGKTEQAFQALRPLVGKLIDAYARALLNDEVVTAAMDARRWGDAVELAAVWLREAGDDERPAVRARLAALVVLVPPDELARRLRERQARASGDISGSELEIRKLLAERLAAGARERRDVRLAQELLATSGPLLGAQGDAIAQLAAGASTARVEAPTVGLLLSARSVAARRRGVDIAAGVSFALGLAGAAAPAGDPARRAPAARLVSRDDGPEGDRVEDALAGLTAEGAAVLIAGVDRAQATAVAAFARAREIPVVLLHPPDPEAVAPPFVFVAGEDPARVREALAAALAERGARPVALVSDAIDAPTTKDPSIAVSLPCDGQLDSRALRSAAVQGLVVSGDSFCAERALLTAQPLGLRVAFGLDATAAAAPGALIATAGRYPFVADATDRALGRWLAVHPAPPSWWAALGRDAGVLAWEGVRGLPATGTEDPAQVRARRRSVAAAIAGAEADLWTTGARGFGGAQVLPREVSGRELKPPSRP
ncbi:MAG: hypothetical protein IT372_22725 [Polyangiaceae bacterium]|nr:hypothetical protein [Polyangiaceae bacterium]